MSVGDINRLFGGPANMLCDSLGSGEADLTRDSLVGGILSEALRLAVWISQPSCWFISD